MTSRIPFPAFALLFFLGSRSASAQEVQLGCQRSPMFADPYSYDNPFVVFAQATKKNFTAPLFRVSWQDVLGGAWDKGTMLYDRKNSQLRYFVEGGDEGGSYQKNYVFLGVKDATFQGLFRFNTREKIQQLLPFSFIQTLPRLGYRTRKLRNLKKGMPNAAYFSPGFTTARSNVHCAKDRQV